MNLYTVGVFISIVLFDEDRPALHSYGDRLHLFLHGPSIAPCAAVLIRG
jgi:hypothetical protein